LKLPAHAIKGARHLRPGGRRAQRGHCYPVLAPA
jgi:hypothetical protein